MTRKVYNYSSFIGYSLMTMKNIKKTKLTHQTKGLIDNYHYGLNIEHAKLVLEKGMILNTLIERHTNYH